MMRISNEALEVTTQRFVLAPDPGEHLVGMLQRAEETPADAPLVVLPPTYGRSMRDYAAVSWFLLGNGFRVVRFDNRCHIGESHGDIYHYSPRTAIADLEAVVAFVRAQLGGSPWGLAAFSLGWRWALRCLRDAPDARLLFGIVGVVDMRTTLFHVMEGDYFALHAEGRLPAEGRPLGYLVSSRFLVDSVELGLHDLDGTRRDLERCRFPAVQVIGEADPWVPVAEVEEAFGRSGRHRGERTVLVLPGVQHQLQKNPTAAAMALEQMVIRCREHLCGATPDEVVAPSLPELVRFKKSGPSPTVGAVAA
jgi:pimeloyl-ACP methyl ester carboxylesterase